MATRMKAFGFTLAVFLFFGRIVAEADQALPVSNPEIKSIPLVAGFTDAKGWIRAIRGDARCWNDNHWETAKVNQSLTSGMAIASGANSTVDVFCNYSVLRLRPNSLLALDQLVSATENDDIQCRTRLTLLEGGLVGNVKKLAKNSSYQVNTANGTMKVRGTDFVICNGKIAAVSGTVLFEEKSGQEHLIDTGHYFDSADAAIKTMPPRPQEYRELIDSMCMCMVSSFVTIPMTRNFIHDPFSPFDQGLIFARRRMSPTPIHFYFDSEQRSFNGANSPFERVELPVPFCD